jgi:hypothetical protein
MNCVLIHNIALRQGIRILLQHVVITIRRRIVVKGNTTHLHDFQVLYIFAFRFDDLPDYVIAGRFLGGYCCCSGRTIGG